MRCWTDGCKCRRQPFQRQGHLHAERRRWGVGQVHRILARRTYMGEHQLGKNRKNKTDKEADEIVIVPVPPIIDRETFDAEHELLQARNPRSNCPRAS
ncbi:recombinase family protein [Sagittula marina]